MSNAQQAFETDAQAVFTATQILPVRTIADVAGATNLASKYVREILVVLDQRGMVGFQPDSDIQVLGLNWDDDDAESLFERLWNDGTVETETITVKATAATHCRCGCGANVAGKRLYRPGHDARHASQVAKAIAAGGSTDLMQALPTSALQVKASNQVHRILARAEAKKIKAGQPRTPRATVAKAINRDAVEGTVKVGRWTYPAKQYTDGTVQRSVKRDGSGEWIVVDTTLVEFTAN